MSEPCAPDPQPDPQPDPLAAQFRYAHLPPQLQALCRPFADLGAYLTWTIPATPARTAVLQQLLAARDAAIAAKLAPRRAATRG